MAALVEGHDYGLISNETSIDQKTVIHVKLTDTALRAIEEFSKIKVGTSRRPSIQFNGKTGVLQFPSRSTSEDPRPVNSFQFFISENPKDPNGSFDCIEQSNFKSRGKLEKLPGSMQYKMGIRATEDVYKTTRERMTIAEEESKKFCAKEIKPSGRHISKKVKKVLPNTSSSSLKPQPSKPSCAVRPLQKPSSNNSVSSSTNHRLSGSNVINGSSSHSPNRPSSLNHSPPNGIGNTSNVSSSGKSAPSSNTNNTKVNSAVMMLPYRDRIIHLLAVRPYKKPELYLRLQKDGIKDKDKNSLGPLLQQVATLNKDQSYSLAKHAYSDVRQDWLYYTEIDRQLLKRNLQNIQQGENRSASNSPAPSPASIISNPDSPTASQKRQNEDNVDGQQPNKKVRISHHKKKKSDREELKPINGINNIVHVPKPDKVSPDSTSDSKLDDNANKVSSKTNLPNYLGSYTPITNTDQRLKYKKDFNTQYEEYRKLHAQIESVVLKFGELKSQMKVSKEGTKDFEELKDRIVKEYEAKKTDPKYVEQKKRYEYLHKKLGHIKHLIIQYDSSQSVCS